MDEITFGDILLHYSLKLKEVFEDVEDIRKLMADSKGIIESSWKGRAADTCSVKLEDLSLGFLKVNNELSDSITKLTGLMDELAEMEVPIETGSIKLY